MWNPFWNKTERRLRALWRLVGFAVLVAVVGTALGAVSLLLQGERIAFSAVAGTTVTTLAILAALWLAGRFLDRRRFVDFGFHFSKAWWVDFAFGLALGALLMGLIFALELAAGWIRVDGWMQKGGDNFWLWIASAFIAFINVGIYEEIGFRGYPLRTLAEGLNLGRIGPRVSLAIAFVVTSCIFGVAHLSNPNATWISTVNIALAGFLLGIGFVLTGEMAIPIGLHISWNFFQGNVFGFPVSGTNAGATFIAITQGGPELVTGGAFGPEAGLVGLAAMALGLALTVAWVKWRRGKAGMKTDLSIYQNPATIKRE